MSSALIEVDLDSCEGFGYCYAIAPQLMSEGDSGQAVLRVDAPAVGDDVLDELIDQCPRRALRRAKAAT